MYNVSVKKKPGKHKEDITWSDDVWIRMKEVVTEVFLQAVLFALAGD